MAIWPWYGRLALGELYGAAKFLDVASYKNVQRWTKQLAERRRQARQGCGASAAEVRQGVSGDAACMGRWRCRGDFRAAGAARACAVAGKADHGKT